MDDYNVLLSRAFAEVSDQFAALASPTLSKQETVSFLYQDVVRCQRGAGEAFSTRQAIALRVEFVARLCLKFLAVVVASRRFRVRAIPREAVFLRTWLVPRSFMDGRVVDDYFRRLAEDLRETCPLVVAFQPLRLRDYFLGFRNARTPVNCVIQVGFLSLSDIGCLFIEFVRSGRVQLSGEYQLRGTDVTSVLNRSLNLDYFKLRSFQAYLDRYVAERVKRYEPKAFVYVFENQAWEKACLRVFRGTKTKCIGYQSSSFSDRFLNFFPTAADEARGDFPSMIMTVGDLFGDVLRTHGCYPVPIVTLAATRFDYPVSEGKYEVKKPRREVFGRILYAFAVHEYQYPGIIRDLIEVFGDTGVEVVLKVHPLCGKKYDRMSLPVNFRIWAPAGGGQLRDLYDAVIFNDNSFGFESLMQGVKAYEYQCESVYSDQRLYNFDVYDCVLDRTGLSRLRDSILAGEFDKSFSVDRVLSYVNYAFRPYSPAASRELLGAIEGTIAGAPAASALPLSNRVS